MPLLFMNRRSIDRHALLPRQRVPARKDGQHRGARFETEMAAAFQDLLVGGVIRLEKLD